MVQDRASYDSGLIVIHGLSNRAIFNDLEGPQTQISRCHSLTLNISKIATDTAKLLWKANRKPYPGFQMVPLSITSSDL